MGSVPDASYDVDCELLTRRVASPRGGRRVGGRESFAMMRCYCYSMLVFALLQRACPSGCIVGRVDSEQMPAR